MQPPNQIDGADVLAWAWSDEPFGVVPVLGGTAIAIYGLAICGYPGSDIVYGFSCDEHWQTQQDADYASVDEAREQLPAQYRHAPVIWHEAAEA